MQETFPIISQVQNSYLVGDFNIDYSWKSEQQHLDPNYLDVFKEKYPELKSYTMPKT